MNRDLAGKIVDLLNSTLAADPCAVHALMVNRVPCNESMVEHPQAVVDMLGGKPVIGLLGFLNGLIYGEDNLIIAARFDHDSRDHCGKLIGFEVRRLVDGNAVPL